MFTLYSFWSNHTFWLNTRSRLREHDVLFLVTIKSPIRVSASDRKAAMNGGRKRGKGIKRSDRSKDGAGFLEEYGVVAVRGCEVYEVSPAYATIILLFLTHHPCLISPRDDVEQLLL